MSKFLVSWVVELSWDGGGTWERVYWYKFRESAIGRAADIVSSADYRVPVEVRVLRVVHSSDESWRVLS